MMKKTKCDKCSAINDAPLHYIGKSIRCNHCSAEYIAIEALTYDQRKNAARNDKMIFYSFISIIVLIIISIPAFLIGGCMHLFNEAEVAREKKEQKRAAFEAKYSSEKSTSDYRSPSHQSRATEWYSGGTLHNSTMKEWRQASYSDRLATAADFSATLLQKQGRTVRSMNDLRPIAVALEAAISETGRGGIADNQSTSDIAAASWILIN